MEKYTLGDNTVLNFIPIEVKKAILGNQTPNDDTTKIPWFGHTVPHIINPDYADFKYFYMEEGIDLSSYSNPTAMESWLEELFDVGDNFKIATLFNGLQFLKIPINRFNDTTVNPNINNYGTYYIKISPKYIETTINVIDVHPNNAVDYLTLIILRAPFAASTLYNFGDTHFLQVDRLTGSIVEIWDSSLQIKKQSKIILNDNYAYENDLNYPTGLESLIVVSPNTANKDFIQQTPTIGDKVRIYPKESYFEPIFIKVSYQSATNDLLETIRYLKNDVSRDLVNNIIEVYDDAGATVNNQGVIDGVVIQSYQISKIGQRELRKRLNI